jgi:hypothetical protein
MEKLKNVFGFLGAIGAIALVLHAIVFFTSMHYGAAAPMGAQVYRITEHSHSVYITYAPHLVIKVLAITMLAGLGLGIPGIFLVEFLRRRNAKDATHE